MKFLCHLITGACIAALAAGPLPLRAQSILGKHPSDKVLPQFYGQNGNADTTIVGLNAHGSGTLTLELAPPAMTLGGVRLTAWPGLNPAVSSVGLNAPSFMSASGSPVTGSGTLGLSWNPQPPNTFLAGPVGGADAAPAFRPLASLDIPGLDAGQIVSGVFDPARIPFGQQSGVSTISGNMGEDLSITAGDPNNLPLGPGGTLRLSGGGSLASAGGDVVITTLGGNVVLSGQGGGAVSIGGDFGSAPVTVWGFAQNPTTLRGAFDCSDASLTAPSLFNPTLNGGALYGALDVWPSANLSRIVLHPNLPPAASASITLDGTTGDLGLSGTLTAPVVNAPTLLNPALSYPNLPGGDYALQNFDPANQLFSWIIASPLPHGGYMNGVTMSLGLEGLYLLNNFTCQGSVSANGLTSGQGLNVSFGGASVTGDDLGDNIQSWNSYWNGAVASMAANGDMYFGGNVGVGAPPPSSEERPDLTLLLHRDSFANAQIDSGDDWGGAQFIISQPSSSWAFGTRGDGYYGSNPGDLVFHSDTGGTSPLILTPDGRAGFGGEPSAACQYVLADDTDPGLIWSWDNRHCVWGLPGPNGGGLGVSYSSADSTVYSFYLVPGIAWQSASFIAYQYKYSLAGNTFPTLALTQDWQGGNPRVGINTATPNSAYALDVNGSTHTGSLAADASLSVGTTLNTGGSATIGGNATVNGSQIKLGGIYIYTGASDPPPNSSQPNGSLYLCTASNGKMYFRSGGAWVLK